MCAVCPLADAPLPDLLDHAGDGSGQRTGGSHADRGGCVIWGQEAMVVDFVDVMLRKCDEALAEVETIYVRDVASHDLSDDLLYSIRTVVQDCQSALDATASRVKDMYLKKSTWKPYFPLGTDVADFTKKIEEQLKGLTAAEPHVAAAFERHQPYHPANAALGYLHALARVNKHDGFSEQIREEVPPPSDPDDPRYIRTIRWGAPVLGATMFGAPGMAIPVFVGWNFVDPSVPVLATVRSLVQQTRAAAEDIHNEAAL
jgi:hypothetical protein